MTTFDKTRALELAAWAEHPATILPYLPEVAAQLRAAVASHAKASQQIDGLIAAAESVAEYKGECDRLAAENEHAVLHIKDLLAELHLARAVAHHARNCRCGRDDYAGLSAAIDAYDQHIAHVTRADEGET